MESEYVRANWRRHGQHVAGPGWMEALGSRLLEEHDGKKGQRDTRLRAFAGAATGLGGV